MFSVDGEKILGMNKSRGFFMFTLFFDVLKHSQTRLNGLKELVDYEQLFTNLRNKIREIQQAVETAHYPLVGTNSFFLGFYAKNNFEDLLTRTVKLWISSVFLLYCSHGSGDKVTARPK
jgi:hypothetical protein